MFGDELISKIFYRVISWVWTNSDLESQPKQQLQDNMLWEMFRQRGSKFSREYKSNTDIELGQQEARLHYVQPNPPVSPKCSTLWTSGRNLGTSCRTRAPTESNDTVTRDKLDGEGPEGEQGVEGH